MSTQATTQGRKKKILAVVANPTVSTTLGWPVGFWASELVHAWYEFNEAGYEVDLYSPKGGKVELDAMSDPRDASGYSAHDILSLGFLSSPKHAALLESTRPLKEAKVAEYDALFIAGGQSPMFTFRENGELQQLVRAFYESGKVTSAVCHGTAALLDVRLADGTYLIAGKQMTGFANSEEDFADNIVGKKVMPYRIEDEARKQGANFSTAPAFRSFAVRDGHLITGQQQNSARAAAELIIAALGH
jgi:putative intracellular protease/amidase